jgi:predicted negative regulator of RcsB-dependent stress response
LLALEPDHDFALKAKGDVLWFLDKKIEALNAYDQAIFINKKMCDSLLEQGSYTCRNESNRGGVGVLR